MKNKLNLCQETVAIVSEMEKQFYQDKVISLEDTPLTTKTTNKVSNKSLIQLESTLFHMASTPDLCEGVLYLFPVKVQDKFIIRYKTLKCSIITFYLILIFSIINKLSTNILFYFVDTLKVVVTEDLQIKLVNTF